LIVSVQAAERMSLEQIRAFLEGSSEVEFKGRNRQEVYEFASQTLRQQSYSKLGRADKGLVRQHLEKMTGLSRSQVTRLIEQYTASGEVKPKRRSAGQRRRRSCGVPSMISVIQRMSGWRGSRLRICTG
jgi:CRP-like cAMP-binding protein